MTSENKDGPSFPSYFSIRPNVISHWDTAFMFRNINEQY